MSAERYYGSWVVALNTCLNGIINYLHDANPVSLTGHRDQNVGVYHVFLSATEWHHHSTA